MSQNLNKKSFLVVIQFENYQKSGFLQKLFIKILKLKLFSLQSDKIYLSWNYFILNYFHFFLYLRFFFYYFYFFDKSQLFYQLTKK